MTEPTPPTSSRSPTGPEVNATGLDSQGTGTPELDLDIETLRKNLIANVGKLFSSTSVALVIGLGSFALSARALTPVEFGMLMLVVTFANAALRLVGFESWQAIIKFAADRRAREESADIGDLIRFGLVLDIAGCVIAAALQFGLAEIVGAWLDWQPYVVDGVKWYALVVLLSITSTPTAILRIRNRFDLIAQHRVVTAAFKLVLVAAATLWVPTFAGVLMSWIAAQIVANAALGVMALQELRGNGRNMMVTGGAPLLPREGNVWRFVVMSNLDSVLRSIREMDVQLIALLLDEAAAGVWRIARQLALVVGTLLDAVLEAVYPQIAALCSTQRWSTLDRYVKQVAAGSALAVVVVLVGFVLLGYWFVRLIFGVEYTDAYLVTSLFIAALSITALIQPLWVSIMSLGAQLHIFRNHLYSTVVYVALLVWLTQIWQLEGVGFAVMGLYVVWGVLSLISYRKLVPKGAV